MTTAEKITLVATGMTALGVGAVLQALVTHFLNRGEREVTVADKSVQMANAMMTRMADELARAQELLNKAQQDGEDLRQKLAETKTAKGKLAEQLQQMKGSLQDVNVQLTSASSAIGGMQGEVQQMSTAGIEQWAAALLADTSSRTWGNLRHDLERILAEQRKQRRKGPDDPDAGSGRQIFPLGA